MIKKLKRKASSFGHWDSSASTSGPLFALASAGTVKFKTSSVADIAKIPSTNCSSRLGVMAATTRRYRSNPSAQKKVCWRLEHSSDGTQVLDWPRPSHEAHDV